MSSTISVSPRTLGDVIPGGLVRSIALVAGGAALVGLAAQITVPLPFTPILLSMQTLAVLLVGSALGSKRGAASMALYALLGVAGLPWFSNHQSGWAIASFGYVVGFIVAAYLVGLLAERGRDRRMLTSVPLMVVGNLALYVFGVAGLMLFTGWTLPVALAKGVLPFLVGDAVKIVIAAGLLPATWKLVSRRDA